MARYGVVEMGGTKTTVGVGSSLDELGESLTFDTTGPEETLGEVTEYLRGQEIDAVGVAAFGPLDLATGRMGVTPKTGWSGTDLTGAFRGLHDVPVGLDTDVNGAALGEARWGAGRGLRSIVYVTVGTGIGGGALIDGEPVHGLGHPEMGHISVRRHPDDSSPGVCPFHGDCLEGLASGPAIAARSGTPAEALMGNDLRDAVEIEAFYLGQLVRDLVYLHAPERVIIGGGVTGLPTLLEQVNERLVTELSGYPGLPQHDSGFVVPPGLGRLSGLAGGLILAERALESVKQSG
jgi:fructokinase